MGFFDPKLLKSQAVCFFLADPNSLSPNLYVFYEDPQFRKYQFVCLFFFAKSPISIMYVFSFEISDSVTFLIRKYFQKPHDSVSFANPQVFLSTPRSPNTCLSYIRKWVSHIRKTVLYLQLIWIFVFSLAFYCTCTALC